MRHLTILYDSQCELCRRARAWLEGQQQFVPLRFVAAGQEEARRLFPELDRQATAVELTVVADSGAVYRGEKAWILCLWALRQYRQVALRLGSPGALWAARQFVERVSRGRRGILRSGGVG